MCFKRSNDCHHSHAVSRADGDDDVRIADGGAFKAGFFFVVVVFSDVLFKYEYFVAMVNSCRLKDNSDEHLSSCSDAKGSSGREDVRPGSAAGVKT